MGVAGAPSVAPLTPNSTVRGALSPGIECALDLLRRLLHVCAHVPETKHEKQGLVGWPRRSTRAAGSSASRYELISCAGHDHSEARGRQMHHEHGRVGTRSSCHRVLSKSSRPTVSSHILAQLDGIDRIDVYRRPAAATRARDHHSGGCARLPSADGVGRVGSSPSTVKRYGVQRPGGVVRQPSTPRDHRGILGNPRRRARDPGA